MSKSSKSSKLSSEKESLFQDSESSDVLSSQNNYSQKLSSSVVVAAVRPPLLSSCSNLVQIMKFKEKYEVYETIRLVTLYGSSRP